MAQPEVIAKNQTGTDIFLPTLGVSVLAFPAATDLTADATFFEVVSDPQLNASVAAGDIILNDGTTDLPSDAGTSYLSASGNFDGPVSGAATNALVKLSDTTGRRSEATGVTVDAFNNISTSGTITAIGISAPLGSIDNLSDVDTTTQTPTVQDRLRWDGSNWVPVKHNHTTTNPTVTDDTASNYEVGSRWVNTLTGTEFVNVDASVGAAVWVKTTETGGSSGFTPNIAQYRSSQNLTIATSPTIVVFDANDFEDSNYIRTGSAIKFNVAGIYKVTYQVCFDTMANSRRTLSTWSELNAVEIVPSRSHAYARNNTDDTGAAGASFFVPVSLNDTLTLLAKSTGTSGHLRGLANQVWVSIEFVRGA